MKNNTLHIYDSGKSLIFTWDTMDKIGQQIANKLFNTNDRNAPLPVRLEATRNENEFFFEAYNLTETDKSKWDNLFKKYDKDGFDPDSLFETGTQHAIIPMQISIQCVNEILPELKESLPAGCESFQANLAVSNPYTVILFEKAPAECEGWLL